LNQPRDSDKATSKAAKYSSQKRALLQSNDVTEYDYAEEGLSSHFAIRKALTVPSGRPALPTVRDGGAFASGSGSAVANADGSSLIARSGM
jgi:hypothetical protein